MVSFVIVSHSEKLADGVIDLARMSAQTCKICGAGGLEDGSYGTSFSKISATIKSVYDKDGVIVLADLGSAVLTSEMAIESLSLDKVKLSECPLVTGAVCGTVLAETGASIEEIISELEQL